MQAQHAGCPVTSPIACCKLARHHRHYKRGLHTRDGSGSRVKYQHASPYLQPVVLHRLPALRFPDCQTSSPAPLNQMGACNQNCCVATRTVSQAIACQTSYRKVLSISYSALMLFKAPDTAGMEALTGNTALTAWVFVCPSTRIASNVHKQTICKRICRHTAAVKTNWRLFPDYKMM